MRAILKDMGVKKLSFSSKSAVTGLDVIESTGKRTKATKVPPRSFYSLSYRYSGEIEITTGGITLVSGKDYVTYMPDNTGYVTEIVNDTHIIAVHFTLDKHIDIRKPQAVRVTDTRIRVLFERLKQSYDPSGQLGFKSMSIFYELLDTLEQMLEKDASRNIPDRICEAYKYMQESFCDPELSVTGIAEKFGVSGSYLRREFAKAYGKSPLSYLKELRINRARLLLESGYDSIESIARICGFSSTSYFIQSFGKAMGKSPGSYRQSLRVTP